jgi:hypothetical protein
MHKHQENLDFTKVDGPDIEPSGCGLGFLFHPYHHNKKSERCRNGPVLQYSQQCCYAQTLFL